MSAVFVLLLLASIVTLTWGLIAPQHLAKTARIKRTVTRKHTGLIFGFLALLFFVLTGVTTPAQPAKTVSFQPSSYNNQQPAAQSSKPTAPAATTKQETETTAVPFTTQNQNDGSLPKGQTKVVQQGVNGTETRTYTVTYSGGKQTAKALISDTVTTQPTPEIVAVGTYVAPPTPQPAPAPAPTPAPASCYPLTNGGNCYRAGEYCRTTDHGAFGIADNGEAIVCANNNGWRWEPR